MWTVAPQFSGSIFDLRPDQEYEIELRIKDPDGLDETRTIRGRTRPIPGDPKTPRAVRVTSASELRTALGAAKAGDVITVANGTYSGSFSMNASGTRNVGTSANGK